MAAILSDEEVFGTQPGGAVMSDDDVFGKPKKPKSAAYEQGRGLSSGLQGAFSALQGLTLGFGDEIAGAAGAVAGGVGNLLGKDDGTTFGERYERTRDAVRGAQDQAAIDNPKLAMATKLMAGAPFVAVGGPTAGLARAAPVGLVRQGAEAAKVAAALSGIQGAGESTADTLAGVARDAGGEAMKGAALGGGATLGLGAIGRGVSAVQRAVSPKSAADFAKLKVAEALARDSRGNPIAIEDAAEALRKLGPEGRVADAAGESTRGLLDTMATLPGQSKTLVEDAIRARQAGRAGRILGAADDALETGGRKFVDELTDLAAAKRSESAPLYAQVRDVPVKLTKEVKALLSRVPMAAWRDTKTIVKADTGVDLDIGKLINKRSVPLSVLDSVKRGLYESASGLKREGKGGVARPLDDVRTALIKRLDEISPKNAQGSIYKQARETFGGFAGMEDALQAGRAAMKDDTLDVAGFVKGLNPGDLQSFRVGALQALRQKVGTEGGQTSLLKFWKEPATQERLRAIFGDDTAMSKFVKNLEAESKLKRLESVGRGSQTASRLAAAGDLDMNPTAVAQAARGNILSPAIEMAGRALGRVRTPEATRDEISRLLLSQGKEGEVTLNMLREYLNRVNDARLRSARTAGAFAGMAQQE